MRAAGRGAASHPGSPCYPPPPHTAPTLASATVVGGTAHTLNTATESSYSSVLPPRTFKQRHRSSSPPPNDRTTSTRGKNRPARSHAASTASRTGAPTHTAHRRHHRATATASTARGGSRPPPARQVHG